MNINTERFLALTALLAAPLIAAPACVLDGSDDDTASNTNANTDSTSPSTTMSGTDTTDASTTASGTDATTEDAGDTTSDDSTGGATDETTADATTTTGGEDLGNCCAPDGATPGCEVPEVEACVCEADPYCCDELWDASCAAQVDSLGCGSCGLPQSPLDCYCTATCDGELVEGPWQVCGIDPVAAAADGQAACEDDLMTTGCGTFACDECSCATAEVAVLDCE